ncbi:hypothetical protein ABIC63_000510 [Pseudacidovorax sp. 1753]
MTSENHPALARAGFTYRTQLCRPAKSGRMRIIDLDEVHNLIPVEGLNYLVGAAFAGATASADWYLGIYAGNYTPTSDVSASNVATLASEFTGYSAATRVHWTPGAVAAGLADNSAAKASFTFTAASTLYGAFLVSAAAKGATTGRLGSIARFTTPKQPAIGDVLTVVAGIAITSD